MVSIGAGGVQIKMNCKSRRKKDSCIYLSTYLLDVVSMVSGQVDDGLTARLGQLTVRRESSEGGRYHL